EWESAGHQDRTGARALRQANEKAAEEGVLDAAVGACTFLLLDALDAVEHHQVRPADRERFVQEVEDPAAAGTGAAGGGGVPGEVAVRFLEGLAGGRLPGEAPHGEAR